ncbi:dual oxidase 1-like isoform X2 [Lasioglossum baleicum]|uniref:dual oxidase 1-like isoform X2 n=1 Tax=Lasioglossum baleicum TaxID=434251 RepID=UPI003FCCD5FC
MHVLFYLIVIQYSVVFNCVSSNSTLPITNSACDKPDVENYQHNATILLDWLFFGYCTEDVLSQTYYSKVKATEYPGYDGWYNNIGRPELGAVDTPLLRRWPAAYEDGVYKPSGSGRPDPIKISEKLFKGDISSVSKTGKNALLVFFGQHIVEEILDAQRPACPPEYFNIKIPSSHRYVKTTGHYEMPVLRTRYDKRTGHSPSNPRQQLNEITPFLDGGLIYGTSKAWSNVLRTYSNGTFDPNGLLAASHDNLYPEYNTDKLPMSNPPPPIHHREYITQHRTEKVERFFKLGNPRGNENPFLLTFGIIWFRWHNLIAKSIKLRHSDWSGERIYNEARKWVIATQQHIVINQWLPEWLGQEFPEYKGNSLKTLKLKAVNLFYFVSVLCNFNNFLEGYDPSIDPQIDQFFQAAAFRFGHTLVPAGVYLRDYGRNGCKLKQHSRAIRTCNNYWMSKNSIFENNTKVEGIIDVEKLIMGMAIQPSAEEDHKIVEDLRGNLFGPLEFSRRDLMALNIQRGRDHGLPDYNTARMAYNLHKVESTSHFLNINREIQNEFLDLYNYSFDNVDTWVGGILETVNGPGELFQAIIIDQFQRIRAGDRFWYKNINNNLFAEDEIKRLESLSFYDILISVTGMDHNDIPRNPFRVPTSENEIHEACYSNKIIRKGECKNYDGTPRSCYHAKLISKTVDKCTDPATYDYFDNSDISFISTFVGLSAILCCFITLLHCQLRLKSNEQHQRSTQFRKSHVIKDNQVTTILAVNEWQEKSLPLRPIIIVLNVEKKQLEVKNYLGHVTRAIDMIQYAIITMYIPSDGNYVMIRIEHNYDLVLKFDSDYLKRLFLEAIRLFVTDLKTISIKEIRNTTAKELLKHAVTKRVRQKKLEQFFRVVFSQALHITHTEEEILKIDATVAKEVIHTELTLIEFSEALSMSSESQFIEKIFNLVDKDKNGFISFREFLDMLCVFLKGSAEDKVKLMFDMYDINGTGRLKRNDFKNMLRSFMETVNADVTDNNLETLVHSMMEHANIAKKETIDLKDFHQILSDFDTKFNYVELEFNINTAGGHKKLHVGSPTSKSQFMGEVQRTMESLYDNPYELRTRIGGNIKTETDIHQDKSDNNIHEIEQIVDDVQYVQDYWYPIMKYLANKKLQIFWLCLYTFVLLGVFAERFYYYSVEREHSGLKQILGYGLAVTRGAASGIMFTYSTLLITMCSNTITLLRDTILHLYIPFDSMIEMHKYIACWGLFFTVLHVIGHGFNFYHISTQSADDLTCLFPNYFHDTSELPKFHYWCFQTITGLSGILLTIVTAFIYLCTLSNIRRALYNWFSLTHSLYPVFYVLIILHGAGRLVQEPHFYYFFLSPLSLFIFDKIITVTRKIIEIPILKADILPSGVVCIVFSKPQNFHYKSGQWIRIACPALQTNEYHPFTLSSAPHEPNLCLHIRAIGPWTNKIRTRLDPTITIDQHLPMIHIDGPYGECHQDWYKYDLSIMIGSGVGVTPFASILKDVVYKSNHELNLECKKVYFLWITRTQEQFEWMVDIIRNIENVDTSTIISSHIFITQFYQKFDLRTILLYICERHFQKISNKSLFTGLKATTHFGRPNFLRFFMSVQRLHPTINKIGVFSCGSPSVTEAVDTACKSIMLNENLNVLFQHYHKSF